MPESSSFLTYMIVVGIIIAIGYSLISRSKTKFKDFKPKLFSETIYDDLKKKTVNQGIKIRKGKLLIGIHEIAFIDRFLECKGKFAVYLFNSKKNELTTLDPNKDQDYDLLLLRAKSRHFIWRLFGIRKSFYMLQASDKDGKKLYYVDDKAKRFIFPSTVDLVSYGNVWINSEYGAEYINEISMKRLNEQTLMYLENWPDKLSHLEVEGAKRERIARVYTELDKGKYEENKKAGDSVVT